MNGIAIEISANVWVIINWVHIDCTIVYLRWQQWMAIFEFDWIDRYFNLLLSDFCLKWDFHTLFESTFLNRRAIEGNMVAFKKLVFFSWQDNSFFDLLTISRTLSIARRCSDIEIRSSSCDSALRLWVLFYVNNLIVFLIYCIMAKKDCC